MLASKRLDVPFVGHWDGIKGACGALLNKYHVADNKIEAVECIQSCGVIGPQRNERTWPPSERDLITDLEGDPVAVHQSQSGSAGIARFIRRSFIRSALSIQVRHHDRNECYQQSLCNEIAKEHDTLLLDYCSRT